MKVHLHRLALPLEHEFTIAYGSTTVQNSLVVELEQDGVSGYGESTENKFYGHSLDSMCRSVEGCRSMLSAYEFGTPMQLWSQMSDLLVDDSFALSALDQAAHDLYGKQRGKRTHEVLELSWDQVPVSSYTIGIADVDQMIEKLRQRPKWKVYKIKLGTDRDVEIIRRLRQETTAKFRVDANCGWTVEETIANSHQLKNLGSSLSSNRCHRSLRMTSITECIAILCCQSWPMKTVWWKRTSRSVQVDFTESM